MLLSIGDVERFYLILRNAWDYDMPFYKNIYAEKFLHQHQAELIPVHKEFDKIFNDVKNENALNQVLYTEFQSKMVNDYLLTDDRMSMAHSVEERVPLLDRDLVDFGFSLPVELHQEEMGIHGEPISPVQEGFEGYRRKDSDEGIHRKTRHIQLRIYPVYLGLPGSPETPVAL